MAAQTWWIDPSAGALQISDPGAESTTSTGWTVAKTAPTVYSPMSIGSEEAAATFGATAKPDGSTIGGSTFDFLNSNVGSPLSGTYALGTWTAAFKVVAVSSGGDQDGLVRACLWKANAAVTVFTLIASPVEGGAVTNLATSAAQASTVTFSSVPSVTLTNEVLILQIGWKITGAGGAVSRDVLLRRGTPITLVTPSFTATPVPHGPAHRAPLSAAIMSIPGGVYL